MSRPIIPLRAFSTSLRSSAPAPANPFSSPFSAPSSSASSSASASKDGSSKADTPSSVDIKALAARLSFMPDTEKEWRKHFHARKIIQPVELSNSKIYAQRSLPAKPPILGPTASIAKAQDPFHITKTNPLDHALNPNFVTAFMDPLGRIKKRTETGLTLKSQKLVGKMVKRAKAMGVVPVFVGRVSNNGLGTRGISIETRSDRR